MLTVSQAPPVVSGGGQAGEDTVPVGHQESPEVSCPLEKLCGAFQLAGMPVA